MSQTVWMGALTVGLLAGCAGSETGNGQKPRERRPVAIELRLVGPAGSLAMPDRSGTVFTIDDALIAVERIELLMPANPTNCNEGAGDVSEYQAVCDEDSDKLRIDGPWVVDLVTGEFDPPLVGIEILDGAYDRVELSLAPGEAGLAGVSPGDALDGATLDVNGSASLGSQVTPFGLTIDLHAFARFSDMFAFELDADTQVIALSLEVQGWFAELDLATCIGDGMVPSVDGELRLELADRKTCGDVIQAVRHSLGQTGKVRVENR